MRRWENRSMRRASVLACTWVTPTPACGCRHAAAATPSASSEGSSSSSRAAAAAAAAATPTSAATSSPKIPADAARSAGPATATARTVTTAAAVHSEPLRADIPAAPTSSRSLAEATERVRAALRALSVVEQRKEMDKRCKMRTATLDAARHIESGPPTGTFTNLSTLGSRVGATARAPDSTASNTTTAALDLSLSAAAASSAVSLASATSSWIRNKRPKFWAIVNEAGNEDEGGGGNTQAPIGQKTDDDAGQRHAASAENAQDAVALAHEAVPDGGANSKLKVAAGTENSKLNATSAPTTEKKSSQPSVREQHTSSGTSGTTEGSPFAVASPTAAVAAPRPTRVTAHSIRATPSTSSHTSDPPFRSRYKLDVSHALAALLTHDPELGHQLLTQLSAESRRLLLIMGTASEYFGVDYGEVAEQIKEADTDRDNSISSKEYDAWVRNMAELASTRLHDDGGHASPPSLSPRVAAASLKSAASPPTSMAATAAETNAAAIVPLSSPDPPPRNDGTCVVTASTPEGSIAHLVAPSATLARQRAEMAIDTARAASARIIEVMQKSVPMGSSASAVASRGGQLEGKAVVASSPASASATERLTGRPGSLVASALSGTEPKGNTQAAAVSAPPAGTSATSASSPAAAPAAATATPASTTAKKKTPVAAPSDPSYIPWSTYLKIVLSTAPPFFAFGILDNSSLVLAGGAIDNVLSAEFGLSQMAAASMGGVVSGVAGIQVHGLAERFTRAKPPQLTAEQERSDTYAGAENVGNTLGMVVGLILGMTPLFFMRRSSDGSLESAADRERFLQEAMRSHARRLRAAEKEETQAREKTLTEEQGWREKMLKEHRSQKPSV